MLEKKSLFILLIAVLLTHLSNGQIRQVSLTQLDSLQKKEKRNTIVFIHTSWCKYCDLMKNTTFKNREVIQLLNENFYFVSLDAEDKKDIHFRGYTFKYKPTGPNTGVHELAGQLGKINGESSYPAICFLNSDYEIIYQHNGYVPDKAFLRILKNTEGKGRVASRDSTDRR